MTAWNTRYTCRCGTALVSQLRAKGCCHYAAARAVRPRSQSCIPTSVCSSATSPISDVERWFYTTVSNTRQSKSSLKDFVQYLSRISPHVDVNSMSRALTSLHLDLPRNFLEIKRLFPNMSVEQLRQTILRSVKLKRDEASKGSDTDPGIKRLPDKHGLKQEAKTTENFASVRQKPEHQPDSQSPATASSNKESGKSSATLREQDVISDSAAAAAEDKSEVVTTTVSSAPVTDSIRSRVNTVTSGIAKQIAEHMPNVDIHARRPAKTKAVQQTVAVDSKEKTKPDDTKKVASTSPKQVTAIRRQLVARSSIERQTRGLVLCLRDARTSTSQLVRLEELCQHISQYPDCTGIAVKVCIDSIMFIVSCFDAEMHCK